MDALRTLSRTRAARSEEAERLRSALEVRVQRYDVAGGGGGGDGMEALIEAEEEDSAAEAVWKLGCDVAMQVIWRDDRSVAMAVGPREAWAVHSVYVDAEDAVQVASDLGVDDAELSAMLSATMRRMDADGWRLPRLPAF